MQSEIRQLKASLNNHKYLERGTYLHILQFKREIEVICVYSLRNSERWNQEYFVKRNGHSGSVTTNFIEERSYNMFTPFNYMLGLDSPKNFAYAELA